VSPTRIAKRDGREVPFDEEKIRSAVARAQAAVGEDDAHLPAEVSTLVRLALDERRGGEGEPAAVPGIEEIQDLVERALIELGRAPGT
jgi:ribonucleoside-triphosphate reductase